MVVPTCCSEQPGVVSEAEAAIRELNASARPALAPFARLLLRTESIASSKVEGMQLGVRELARAEARFESGGPVGSTALEIMANINAMELAIDEAAAATSFSVQQLLAIHRKLMERASNAQLAGHIRTVQNWIGGNDYTRGSSGRPTLLVDGCAWRDFIPSECDTSG
jgi:Fic family protein